MRSRVKWFLTAVLAAVLIGPAFGQLIPGMIPLLEEGLGAPALLLNKGVQKEIQLTDEQREKFRKIVSDVYEKYQPDLQKARTDPKKFAKVTLDSTMESRDKVMNTLTDEQKSTWKEMTGKKFDFKLELLNLPGARP